MAQKKLLFPIIFFMLLVSSNTYAALNAEDMDFVSNLVKTSRQISLQGIKEKWLELQDMRRKIGKNTLPQINDKQMFENNTSSTVLRVFVSSSMNLPLLKNYAKQAKKYNAVLVFNGLPDGSWRKLSDLVYSINGDTEDGIAMQIDDIAFDQYGITSVPSFILSKEAGVFDQLEERGEVDVFDKVVGNIGIKRALQEFAEYGDLADIANDLLNPGAGR